MIWLDLWLVHGPIVPVVFSLGGHTDTYRRVAYGGGAFELCMPSLGFLFTKLTLRSLLLGQACRMAREPPFPRIGRRQIWNTMSARTVRPQAASLLYSGARFDV